MPESAPILIFCFDRPDHLRRVLESLSRNPESADAHLILRMDGPPANASPERLVRMEDVRTLLRERSWCGTTEIHESAVNKGLAASVIEGVTDAVARFGKVIVLEDDLECSPHFLRYMNKALEVYADQEQVISISGYIYPIKATLPETFFLRGADCWGWATWKRGWDLFRSDGAALLAELQSRGLASAFDFDGSYPYTRMLTDQVNGKNDSWAIRWYASAFLAGKLSLYPGRSLVQNIGIDGSGTHSGSSDRWKVDLASTEVEVRPANPAEDPFVVDRLQAYFSRLKRPQPVWKRILSRLRRIF
jgi:hypothetical protein